MQILDFFASFDSAVTDFHRGLNNITKAIDSFNSNVISVANDIVRSVDNVSNAILSISDGVAGISTAIVKSDDAIKNSLSLFANFYSAMDRGGKALTTLGTAHNVYADAVRASALSEKGLTAAKELGFKVNEQGLFYTESKRVLNEKLKWDTKEGITLTVEATAIELEKEKALNLTARALHSTAAASAAAAKATGVLTIAQKLSTTVHKIAAVGIKIFTAALKATGIGLIIAAVNILINGLQRLGRLFTRESAAVRDLRKENEKLTESTNKLIDAKRSSEEAHNNQIRAIETEEAAALGLLSRMTALSNKIEEYTMHGKDTVELHKQMAAYTNILSDSVEGLNLQYDLESGMLSESLSLIREQIEARAEQARATAAQERAVELARERIKIEEQLYLLGRERASLEEQNQRGIQGLLENTNERYEELNKMLKDNEAAFAHNTSIIVENMMNATDAVDNYAAAVEEAEQRAAYAMAAMEKAQRTALESLAREYTTISGAMTDMFNKIRTESEVTIASAEETLGHNIEVAEQWAEDIDLLMSKDLYPGFVESLKAMGIHGAAEIRALVSGLDDDPDGLQRLSDLFAEGGERATNVLATIFNIDTSVADAARMMALGSRNAVAQELDAAGFFDMGADVVHGLIDGITAYYENAKAAGAALGNAVTRGTRGELRTQSPSREFMNIGEMIGQGLINGISSMSKSVNRTIESLCNGLINISRFTLGIHSPSKRFAEEIGLPIVQGIESGIEDNAYLAENAAANMSEDVFDKASEWISNYQRSIRHTAREELRMWQQLTRVYRDESDERLKIDQNIHRLQNELGREKIDDANRWLELRRRNAEVSTREEVALWQAVTTATVEGTQAREDAERRLHESTMHLIREREDLENRILQLQTDHEDAVSRRADAILNTFRLFDGVNEREEVSYQTLIDNLNSQVEELRDWEANLATLEGNGIYTALLETLREMGPAANAEIAALAQMSEEQLAAYAETWREKHALARSMAIEELEPLREETEAEIEKLTDRLNYLADTGFVEAGVNTIEGYVSGVRSAFPQVEAAAMEITDIITRISEDSDNTIGVHFQLYGEDGILAFVDRVITDKARMFETGVSGIVRKVVDKFTEMGRSVQDIIRRMMDAVDNILRIEGYNVGRNFFRALGEGLISEQANLLTQALQTAAAIRAAFESSHSSSITPFAAMGADIFPGATPILPAHMIVAMQDTRRDAGDINQYFYGVREEKTAYQVYRAAQRALTMEFR